MTATRSRLPVSRVPLATARPPARPPARRVVRAIAAVAAVLAVGSVAWVALSGASMAITALLFAGTTTIYLAVGALILERRRGNRTGVTLLVLGLGFTVYLALDAFIRVTGPSQASRFAAFLIFELDGPLFFTAAMLILLFPDGRLPSRRWRWLVAIDACLASLLIVLAAFRPGPFAYYPSLDDPVGIPGYPFDGAYEAVYTLVVGGVLLAALSLVGRWRRGGALERAQLKWVAAAAGTLALAMMFYGGTAGPGRYSELGDLMVGIGFALIPLAVGFAVLRYRLYDIDRIVGRTVSYAIVTGLLAIVFVASNLALQWLIAGVTGSDTITVAASTLLVAALFQPLRKVVQAPVDRRFNRATIDAERMVATFAGSMRDEVDLGRLLLETRLAALRTVQPVGATVWLRGDAPRPVRAPVASGAVDVAPAARVRLPAAAGGRLG